MRDPDSSADEGICLYKSTVNSYDKPQNKRRQFRPGGPGRLPVTVRQPDGGEFRPGMTEMERFR